ncbi:hypothetical protein CK203_056561 [Vitis vinifera]|uniref:Uncharacterized protein n=1 Tax=Vitis vinifera TaxID=29760 RepID=A0A438GKG8_VITVI|nr:hypothetical protein CK203_056561 [Vitis vinifera]
MYLVKWSIGYKEKPKDGGEEDGLGIGCLYSLNMVILGKWCWRYALKGEASLKESMERKRWVGVLAKKWEKGKVVEG